MLMGVQLESSPFSIQPPCQLSSLGFSKLIHRNCVTPYAMQASRTFIAMLVLVASAFTPVLSAPLEYVVVPLFITMQLIFS